MAYKVSLEKFNQYLADLNTEYKLFAPVELIGKGPFTDTNSIRYCEVKKLEEICFDKKSNFSAKEVITPITQTLFYFTEDNWGEPKVSDDKILLLVRSCDIHALKRLDDIYLKNGAEDPYYKVLREKVRLCLIECQQSFTNCFCVSMKTNIAQEFDLFVRPQVDSVYVGVKMQNLTALMVKNKLMLSLVS